MPKIYDDEDTELERLRQATGIGRDEEDAMEREAYNGAAEDIGEHGGFFKDRERVASRGQLGKAEKAGSSKGLKLAEDAAGIGEVAALASLAKSFFWGSKKRKGASVGGGLAAVSIGGLLALLGIISGPAQYLELGNFLTKTHLSGAQNQSDRRTGDMLRDYKRFKAAKDGSGWERTRMGIVGNKAADKFEASMEKNGVKFGTTAGGRVFNGVEVDPTKNEETKNLNPERSRDYLENRLGLEKGTITISSDGKLLIPDSAFSGVVKGRLTLLKLMKFSGKGNIIGAEAGRLLSTRYNVSFHPITRDLKRKVGETAEAWAKRVREKFKTYVEGGDLAVAERNTDEACDGEKYSKEECDKAKQQEDEVKQIDEEAKKAGEAEVSGDEKPKDDLIGGLKDKIKGTSKAGAILAVYAIGCAFKELNDQWTDIKMVRIIAPLIRLSAHFYSVASQIQTGQDVDDGMAGSDQQTRDALFDSSTSPDDPYAQTGWMDATTVRQQMLKDGYTDIPQTTKGTIPPETALTAIGKDAPGHQILNAPGIKQIASVACSQIVGWLAIGVSVLSDFSPVGIIKALGGVVAGEAIGKGLEWVLDQVVNIMLGAPIGAFPRGAQTGNQLMYATRMASNSQMITEAGGLLSQSDVDELAADNDNILHSETLATSLGDRMFSLDYPQSFASQLMMKQKPVVLNNLTSFASSMTGMWKSIIRIPANLISKPIYADSDTEVDYGCSVKDDEKAIKDGPGPCRVDAFGFDNTTLDKAGNPLDNSVLATKVDDANGYYGLDTPCYKYVPIKNSDGTYSWKYQPQVPCIDGYVDKIKKCFHDEATHGKPIEVEGPSPKVKKYQKGDKLTSDEFLWQFEPGSSDGSPEPGLWIVSYYSDWNFEAIPDYPVFAYGPTKDGPDDHGEDYHHLTYPQVYRSQDIGPEQDGLIPVSSEYCSGPHAPAPGGAWSHIRVLIFDTFSMKAADCYVGGSDSTGESCSSIGAGSNGDGGNG